MQDAVGRGVVGEEVEPERVTRDRERRANGQHQEQRSRRSAGPRDPALD